MLRAYRSLEAIGIHDLDPALDGSIAASWLARVSLPRLLVDRTLTIQWANAAAVEVLESGLCVRIDAGRLHFEDLMGQQYWQGELAEARPGTRRLVLTNREGRAEGVIGIMLARVGKDAIWCLSLISIVAPLDLGECGLIDTFKLTATEAAVIQMLTGLHSPREIADKMGISINTVRTHVRNIYHKVGVRSQGELLRLASSYCIA